MMQDEAGLFQVTITEEGKKYIRKFAAISLLIIVLVVILNGVTIYWNIKTIIKSSNRTGSPVGFIDTFYNYIFPYFLILSSLFAVVANLYYIQFPRVLLSCINANDEYGANKAFGLIYKGAFIFLVWLVIDVVLTTWSFFVR